MSATQPHLDPQAVAALLPQRPPLLLVDRVVQLRTAPVPEIEAAFSIPADHPVLAGHFPGRPVWPGSYTIEGLAQTCALVGATTTDAPPTRPDEKAPAMVAAVKVKLRRPVLPPAELVYRARHTHTVGAIFRFAVEALCNGETVADGTLDVVVSGAQP